MKTHRRRLAAVTLLVAGLVAAPATLPAGPPQVGLAPFTLEEILAPAYPIELVAARDAERIAWTSFERGMRNVYTAAAPDFEPVRLTDNLEDDGVDLTSLQISADGSVAVYVRGHTPNRDGWIANPSSDPRGAERAIWAVRTDGGEPWRVTVGADPRLSPDGRWVLFERDGQIHRAPVQPRRPGVDAAAEAAEPLFRAFGDNGDPVWSPDGRFIAWESDRDDHSFIGVYDTTRAEIRWLAPGVDDDSSPTWSPDSRRVAFIRRPGDSFGEQLGGGRGGPGEGPAGDSAEVPGLTRSAFASGATISFQVADAVTGEAREFWHDAAGDDRFDGVRSLEWAGEHVVFEAEPGNWSHRFSVPVAGGVDEPADLTPGEGIAEHASVSPDGRWLYTTTNVGDIDRRHLWRTPVAGGEPEQLVTGTGIQTYPAVMSSGSRVALFEAGARHPQAVALVEVSPTGATAPQVIFPDRSDFPVAAQVVPENVVLTAEDGLEFHNQLFVPDDIQPGERRPAILFTHGGPRRQMLLGYHYMHFYHMAYAVNQYLAARGYVVISVNYRSGIGYGEEFRNAPDRGRRGNSEYQDVVAAGRYLQQRPDVDPERIGLWGLSYGGILTAQGLARNSDIFAAGVDMAGVHLWGDTLDPDDVAYSSSSISAIEGWTSPVLLIHGDDDRNVAFSQTTGLVQLLRAHGVHHELIVFPDEVHDFLIFDRWLISFRAMDEFFDRFLAARDTTAGR